MIYIVEDDENIRELVVYTLKSTGFEAEGFERGDRSGGALKTRMPSLVLLDIMLPEEDGLTILKRLRTDPRTKRLPIMMLTAKGTEYDKVLGLDGGADDYIAKPFGMMELVARIRALLRRTADEGEAGQLKYEGLCVDKLKHTVTADGNDVALTFKEFELLCTLLEADGNVMTRDTLLTKIWGYDFDGETRTVDVHVRTLRQKLGHYGEIIETVRGLGYRIKER